MADIKFRIAAKTDVGCARTNNEDNFQAAADLTAPTMTWINNQSYDLGDKGALLVVADGMGGMNAGEIASEIAIETIREYFTPDRITAEVIKNRFSIEKYMKDVVVEADHRIKQRSTDETRGMGTTIVMAWLIGDLCHVCWCGDSRAYIYNPVGGLFQVSKDHSYVQSLVDAGEISEEDAFDYPNSNVITRCLCDAKQKAVPDCLLNPQPLCNGDIILLCSDGLSGMLRDNEMQAIIEANRTDMNVLTDALIDGALKAGGNDNVTVAVATIDSGGAESTPARVPAKVLPKPHLAGSAIASRTAMPSFSSTKRSKPTKTEDTQIAVGPAEPEVKTTNPADKDDNATKPVKNNKKGGSAKLWAIVGFLACALLCAAAYFLLLDDEQTKSEDPENTETIEDEEPDKEFEEPEETEDPETQPAQAPSPAPTARPISAPFSPTGTIDNITPDPDKTVGVKDTVPDTTSNHDPNTQPVPVRRLRRTT